MVICLWFLSFIYVFLLEVTLLRICFVSYSLFSSSPEWLLYMFSAMLSLIDWYVCGYDYLLSSNSRLCWFSMPILIDMYFSSLLDGFVLNCKRHWCQEFKSLKNQKRIWGLLIIKVKEKKFQGKMHLVLWQFRSKTIE